MNYYEVWVSDTSYHGSGALTYSSADRLTPSSVVRVPIKNKEVLGWVVKEVSKPRFKTKAISSLLTGHTLPNELIDLHKWISSYYPAPLGQITNLFLPSYLSVTNYSLEDEVSPVKQTKKISLTTDQKAAIKRLSDPGLTSAILHGTTGSGKTMVYAEIAKDVLKKGRSVLILTPEIGLTPQLTKNMQAYLGIKIYVIHSGLTPKQRASFWSQIANNKDSVVVIGPRSALFSPINNLGLILIDEFHDQAYKQEQAPHYQSSRVASQLAKLHKAKLVMGSATPSIDVYYAFEQKKLPIINMSSSAIISKYQPPIVKVVSLKDRDKFSRSNWMSDDLLNQISVSLDKKQQSLVFLNRRGTAKLALCQVCGWQALCPKCDIPLTYHGDGHRLLCHTCGYHQSAPSSCPVCRSTEIIFKGVGTKLITDELSRLFPSAKISRFDSDNKKSERFDQANYKRYTAAMREQSLPHFLWHRYRYVNGPLCYRCT